MESSAALVEHGGRPPADGADRRDDLRVVSLGRGHGLVIRPLRHDDRPALEAFFAELPEDDVRLRFFSGSRPSRRILDNWFAGGDDRSGRLVALEDGVLVGDAGWYRLAGGDAEFDIAVRAHHRGWLGPFLLDAVVEHARDHGIRNLIAEVDWSNGPMLAVLRERGYATIGHDDASILRVVIGAREAVPVWSDRQPRRPRILLEGHALPWAADALARTYGAELLACHIGSTPGPNRCPALAGRPCPLAAGADAVVVLLAPDDERALDLLAAHQLHHPDVARAVTGWSSDPPADVLSIDRVDADGVVAVLRHAGAPVELARRKAPAPARAPVATQRH